jgi:CheY-like chemotaxis protein
VPGKNVYTLAQAAQILGMPEQQVLDYVDRKELVASFNQGLMSHMIEHDQLVGFMKARRMFAQLQKIVQSRVLLCDRDQQVVFIVRTELERGGKVVVHIATSGKEVEMALNDQLPDVLVMHIAATQRQTDNLAGILRHARERRPIRLIIYHNEPDAIVDARDDIKRLREFLHVDAMVSIAAGTRKLIQAIEETLGIRRETRTIGPTKLGTPPAATPPPGSLPTQTPPPSMLPTQPPPAAPPTSPPPVRRTTLIPPPGPAKTDTKRRTLPPPA